MCDKKESYAHKINGDTCPFFLNILFRAVLILQNKWFKIFELSDATYLQI